ncbi:MAG TPA: DUF5676 family membrane protein [Stellaceae bacterium]|nr:DUF5676 family membrane protein [Stellaceae bacterium]
MSQTSVMTGSPAVRGQSASDLRTIPIVTFGLALSGFFGISYVICILGYLLLPGLPVQHESLSIFLPGFALLSWGSFVLGLIESYLWGWYIAALFGWLYNFFLRQTA